MSTLGNIDISKLKPEYTKLLSQESQLLIKFMQPYYSKLENKQQSLPNTMLNWFKDLSLNYQNLMHDMTVTQYSINKREEKVIKQGDVNREYQERFQDEFQDGNKKVKILGFTQAGTSDGTTPMQTPQLPPEFQKYLQLAEKNPNVQMQPIKQSGGELHQRRLSRAKSMFRDYGNMKKYNNKIDLLSDPKPHLIKALIIMYNEYKNNPSGNTLFKTIMDQHYSEPSAKQQLITFMEEAQQNKYNIMELSNWINQNGKLLVREFSNNFMQKQIKLPYELNKRMNYNPNMYNEFFPLVIQDFVEKKLNKRYEFTVTFQAGPSKVLKLDLEVLSRAHFEPIQFPVFFTTKPEVQDPEYNEFMSKQRENTKESTKRRRNITFMLGRFLLMQSLHMPWIQQTDINAKVMMTPFKKQIPYNPKNRVLGATEINSGSNYINKINVWRREELNKLIIHESIHLANIDHTQNMGLESFIKENMAIDPTSELRLYETYTEISAVIINTMVTIYEMFLINHKWDKYATQLRNHYDSVTKVTAPNTTQVNVAPQPQIKQQPPVIDMNLLTPERQFSYKEKSKSKSIRRKSSKPKSVRRKSSKRKSSKRKSSKRKSSKPKSVRIKSSKRQSSKSKSKSSKLKSGSEKSHLKSLLDKQIDAERKQTAGGLVGYSLDVAKVIDEIKDVLVIYFRLEQIFSAFQTAKVLHFYGFESSNEFFHPKKTSKRIKQETSVLSYYIIKGGLLNAIDKFVTFVLNMNKSTPEQPILNLKFDPQHADKFKALISDCVINNTNYHESIDFFLREIRSKKMYPQEASPMTHFRIDKSLRMTLIELTDEKYEY